LKVVGTCFDALAICAAYGVIAACGGDQTSGEHAFGIAGAIDITVTPGQANAGCGTIALSDACFVCFAVGCDVARGYVDLSAGTFHANAVDATCFFIDEAIAVVVFAIACFGGRCANCGLFGWRGLIDWFGFWFGLRCGGFVGVGWGGAIDGEGLAALSQAGLSCGAVAVLRALKERLACTPTQQDGE
jgi:hypothetical protein